MNSAYLYPLLAVMIWAMNSIISKMSVGMIDPFAISFYRWVLAFLLLTPFVIKDVRRDIATMLKNAWKLAIFGLLAMAVYQCLIYYAAKDVSATSIGIFLAFVPTLTMLLSLVILRTPITRHLVLGCTLSLMGVIYLVTEGSPSQIIHTGIGHGELLLFLASAGYALYGVLILKWPINISRWSSLYAQIFFGCLFLLPVFFFAGNIAITQKNIGLILYAGIPASIIAPFLWMKGIALLGANRCSLFLNLSPVFTAILAIIIFKEQIHTYHFIGGGAVLVGVMWAQGIFKRSKPNL